jgi:hypothetical protein
MDGMLDGRMAAENPPFLALTRCLRLPHGADMNGFLAICGICREIIR